MLRVGGMAVVTILVICLAATASAAPPTGDYSGPFVFELEGTNGYRIDVLAAPSSGSEGLVEIFVDRRDGEAIYAAPATFGDSGFEADLGRLGRIALRAQPSGKLRRLHSVCADEPVRYEPVAYVGEFEFRGEGGYTEASATRLPFRPRPLIDATCFFSGETKAGGDGVVGAGLTIGSRGRMPHLTVMARTNGHHDAVELFASLREERGDIRIVRLTGARGNRRSFVYSPDVSTARLAPPAPFHGQGVFRRAASPANRWTGDLRVDFPGRPDLLVTGDRFRAVLRHGEWQTESLHPLRPASGLHPWPSTKP